MRMKHKSVQVVMMNLFPSSLTLKKSSDETANIIIFSGEINS